MGYQYSSLIDRAKIAVIIGTNYLNRAKLVNSGLITFEGDIAQGTTEEWIRSELFETDSAGQAIGVNSEISLKGETQTLYKMPVVWRADGALLDDIYEEISVKEAVRRAEATVQNGVMRKSAQMVDEVFVSILNGMTSYMATNDTNYLDKNGNQISPKILQEGKAENLDEGDKFDIIVCRSLMYFQLGALGMAAYTAQTLGAEAQDSLTRTGKVVNDTYLGMTVLMTDKLKNQGGTITEAASSDHYVVLSKKGAFRGKSGRNPLIDPIQRKERGFQDVLKFRIKNGGSLKGMSWQGSADANGVITNTQLETTTNWTTAVKSGNEKYIPISVIRVDQPSFA